METGSRARTGSLPRRIRSTSRRLSRRCRALPRRSVGVAERPAGDSPRKRVLSDPQKKTMIASSQKQSIDQSDRIQLFRQWAAAAGCFYSCVSIASGQGRKAKRTVAILVVLAIGAERRDHRSGPPRATNLGAPLRRAAATHGDAAGTTGSATERERSGGRGGR